jgi:signal transduction histidine kinase/ActR/RegA family two-component response regulator
MKLRTRLFALVVLTLLPVVAIEIYDEIDARARRSEEGKDQALRLVRLVAQEQAKVVEGARQLLTVLAKTPVLRGGDEAPCSAFLADLVRSYPQYVSLVSIDLTGRSICAGGRVVPEPHLADRPFFKLAIQNRDFAVGEYDVDDRSGQRSLYLAQPYYDSAGQVSGVVAAALSLDWLNSEIARNPLPPKATVSAVDRQGTIIARYPGSAQFVGTRIPGQSHSYMLTGGEGVQEALGFDGIARIYSYAPLPGGPSGMTLSVGLDKGELLKGSKAANRRDITVIAGSCALALLLAAMGARAFIGRPIRLLLDAAEYWRQGDLGARVGFPEARSEFGRLGAAFNAMAAAIGDREQELEHRVQARTEELKQAMERQQAAELALHESQKMETVGRLTGGVAHDFNNILAAVIGNIDLACAHLGPGDPRLPWLEAAILSANRGAALIQQLLAFARRQNLRPETVDLNRYIRGSLDMLQRLLRSDVVVEARLAPEAWPVRADPNQFEAAMLNLAINARDAMPDGGTLRLETKNISIAAADDPTGLQGDFVAIIVTDTGTGIPPKILEKVFDPFFTTKEVGAGSGLGLSMVLGFAQQSSGSVRIESELGCGTTVTLYLPRSSEDAKALPIRAEAAFGGSGTILLVDDNAEVRSVTAQLLEMTGYSVRAVSGAPEAIACFEREGRAIDMLVADLVLANGRDGVELAAALRDRRPGLPVLLITGYSEAVLKGVNAAGIEVLTKPFEHVALSRAVRRAMRGGAADLA